MTGTSRFGRVRRWARSVGPRRDEVRDDMVAGVPNAISSVPDGMATAVLVGVNPVYGLYASVAGPIAGGLSASTRLMVITTTSAAALAAGSALSGTDPADRAGALWLLTVLAGVAMVVASALRLGRYARFVSHSVMIGFLTGVSVNIVASQLPDLLGVEAEGRVSLTKGIDALLHLGSADAATAACSAVALLLAVGLDRTPLKMISAVAALAVPTIAVAILGTDSVALVRDQGDIPTGFPLPALPELSLLSADVVAGALAVAAIVLVQGTGVAESAPNRSGPRASTNQDFVAQGVANLAAGTLKGIPVGASVGQTALNVSAGARSRWAAIWAGVWLLAILLLFAPAVGRVVTAGLAAVLVVAAASSFRIGQIRTILMAPPASSLAMVVTFVATLLLPVATAVGIGVLLSLALQLRRDLMDLVVRRVVEDDAGHFVEVDPPTTLPDDEVVLLDVYGSLLYAGARTLQARLPDPSPSSHAVVVLRLRGRTGLGATFLAVAGDYARRLQAGGGRLYLSGLEEDTADALARTGALAAGSIDVFEATPVIGESSRLAVEAGRAWLVAEHPLPDEPDDVDGPDDAG